MIKLHNRHNPSREQPLDETIHNALGIALVPEPTPRGVGRAATTWTGLLVLALSWVSYPAAGQVTLNEVMANNKTAVANGSEYPDYVELYNAGAASVSLAGMRLTDDPYTPAKFVFPAGTTIAARGYARVWCDTNTAAPGLHTGFGLNADTDLLRLYAANGALLDAVDFGVQVPDLSIGRVPDGTGTWQLTVPTPRAPNEAQPLAPPTQLRLNEWMAKPASGDDWLEVYNGASLPVHLSGLVITDTPSGTPANRAILPLSFVGAHGFIQFFASDLDKLDADHLDFKLGSSGETLTIYATDRATIIDRVVYGNQSDNISQGRAPDGSDNIIYFPAGRATPDEPNFAGITNVVISEVLSHTDPPLEDAIELHNPTVAPVNIGNWWLSDAASQPKKYRIPAGTTIPAFGFKVFYEYQINAGAIPFTLDSSEGDEVYLSAGDASGNLTGEQLFVTFGGLNNGVSVGRYRTSAGVDFVPLSRRTFGVDNPSTLTQFRTGTGLSNAPARVGPVVISEIHFQPAGEDNSDDEFIELHNPTAQAVPLYDPLYPTNRWRLRDGVTFDFPPQRSLPAGGYLLLVGFDPVAEPETLAAFRSKFAVPAGVSVLGPFSGKLSDIGETLKLSWPDEPQGPDKPNPGYVPYEWVEMIKYAAGVPWPAGAAGTGSSLQRRVALDYGNEPLNWFVAAPTAGRANAVDSDGDGMPDAWETTYNLNPQSAADATADADADGASNLEEYQAGTHPRDSQSVLRFSSVMRDGSVLRVRFQAVAGRDYSLYGCRIAAPSFWQVLTNLPTASVSGPVEVVLPIDGSADWMIRLATPTSP